MQDIYFNDYIEKYKKINNDEWIVIYDKNSESNYENDVFTFCALLDKNKVYENDYLNDYEWGFSTDSFGKGGFGTYGWGDEREMYCFDGTTCNDFEYLVALRYFDKYETSVEINPKFIWYGNLVKQENGYVEPISDELIIKSTSTHIEVKREYLKDFLCAFNQVCAIVFDHRRYFKFDGKVKEEYKCFRDDNYYILLSVSDNKIHSLDFDGCSSIIGKVIISGFKKPRHRDYKYFNDEKQFEDFIVDYDEDEDEVIEYTCNEDELANYFGANPNAPHFLTPVFFEITVLEKYKNDSRNYTITDSNIYFLGEWSIPFNINEERKVSVWLGDLGRIPYEEQKYWKTFNIKPEGKMDSKFVARQLFNTWTDASRIESLLVPALNKFNSLIATKYGDVIFNVLSDADKEIYNTFMLPINYSIPEYQSFLMKLSKLTCESINIKLIKNIMGTDYNDETKKLGSIGQLGVFLNYIDMDQNDRISSSLKKAYNSRNKLSGHSASFKEYNKVWKRDEDYKFNSVEDARCLIEEIISAIEYVIADNEVKNNGTN